MLLQALTDLVCVSSACPDDIDAANGWNPTDIHVRVYPRENVFSKAVGLSHDTRRRSEANQGNRFPSAGLPSTRRNFTEYNGYWLANSFTNRGALDEYWACRERAAIMDLSALRKFEVLGPDAERLMQWVLTRNIRRLAIGQVVYSAMCYETGGMIDDGTAFPARRRQLPLDRRLRLWRRMDARAGDERWTSMSGSGRRPISFTTSPSRARRAGKSSRK